MKWVRPIAIVVWDLLLLLVVYSWCAGLPLCRQIEEMDINTGRVRYSYYFLNCKVSEREEDSLLSTALGLDATRTGQPSWQCVARFSMGVRERGTLPFGGVHGQLHSLADLWQMAPFTAESKRAVAAHVLFLWRKDHDYSAAEEYLSAVFDIAAQKSDASDRVVNASDLPSVPER